MKRIVRRAHLGRVAVILGPLMPASNDPRKARDVFPALLTMDGEGLRRRRKSRGCRAARADTMAADPLRTVFTYR